jgi:hypothetical protein
MKESHDYIYADKKVMSIYTQIWTYLKNFVQHVWYVVLSFQTFWFNFHRIVNLARREVPRIYILFYWTLSHSILNLPFEPQSNILCFVVICIYSFYYARFSLDPFWLSPYHPIPRFALTDSMNLLLTLDKMLSTVASLQNCDYVRRSSQHIVVACISPVMWKCFSQ